MKQGLPLLLVAAMGLSMGTSQLAWAADTTSTTMQVPPGTTTGTNQTLPAQGGDTTPTVTALGDKTPPTTPPAKKPEVGSEEYCKELGARLNKEKKKAEDIRKQIDAANKKIIKDQNDVKAMAIKGSALSKALLALGLTAKDKDAKSIGALLGNPNDKDYAKAIKIIEEFLKGKEKNPKYDAAKSALDDLKALVADIDAQRKKIVELAAALKEQLEYMKPLAWVYHENCAKNYPLPPLKD